MPFDQIVGNEKAARYLANLLAKESVPSALLFAGPEGVGKGLFAKELALRWMQADPSALYHADLHLLQPEGKLGMHSIASIRQMIGEVYLPPYLGARKAFILHDADRMLPYSANALLKTLEEPLDDTLIILLASSVDTMLPTILSRCHKLYFHALSPPEIEKVLCTTFGIETSEAKKRALFARGSLGQALRQKDEEQEESSHLLLELLQKSSSYIELTRSLQKIVEKMERLKKSWQEELSSMDTKETEGVVAVRMHAEVEQLLESILSWYRDLHLLRVSQKSPYLLNPSWKPFLQERLQAGSLPALDFVCAAVSKTLLAYERSLPLSHCLEALFLEIG